MVKLQHYVTFKIVTDPDVKVSADFNWEVLFAPMKDWEVTLIRFEQGVNIPANESSQVS
jgi:hypothetical protein